MPTLQAEHNLSPTELAQAIAGLAKSEGVEDDVLTRLQNSGKKEAIHELFLREILVDMQQSAMQLQKMACDNIQKYFKQDQLQNKSTVNLPGNPFNPAIFTNIQSIAADTFSLALRQQKSPMPILWVHYDLETPNTNLRSCLEQAYAAGKTLAGPNTQKKDISIPSWNKTWELAILFSISECLLDISTYAWNNTNSALTATVQKERAEFEQYTYDNLTDDTNTTKDMPIWRERFDIFQQYFNEEKNIQKLNTILEDCLRSSYNCATIYTLIERNVQNVQYNVDENACSICKNIYLGKDGNPRSFSTKELLAHILKTGGKNRQVKQKDYSAGILLHPNCNCSFDIPDINSKNSN